MIFTKTKIAGIYIVDPEPKVDERGYFERVYCINEFSNQGIDFKIVQVNQALTKKKGTIRGPHIQKTPYNEGKFVQCIKGSIFDVAIDLRPNSKTFGAWIGNVLSFKNKKMMLIPKGFAHGYQALENNTIMQYGVSQYYHAESVIGIRYDDSYFNIQWPIKRVFVSDIDKSWPLFKKKNK